MIKLDIDVDLTLYDPEQLLRDKIRLVEALGYHVVSARWKKSSSGSHVHLIIEVDPPFRSARELFYAQFLLGDDPKRSQFNFLRESFLGDEAVFFNVLFEKKVKLNWRKKLYFFGRWLSIKLIATFSHSSREKHMAYS